MNQTFENPLIEKRKLQKKRERVREYLRDYGILPTYGTPLTEEQQKIIDQIQNNDFSYQENFVRNKEIIRIGQIKTSVYQNIPAAAKQTPTSEDLRLKKKRQKVREYLRSYGALPPYGQSMTEEQEEIILQIENNDFSYQEKLAKSHMAFSKKAGENISNETTNMPKHVYFRLRILQMLPALGEPLSEIHQQIIDDVKQNWEGKTKNFFITKYLSYSTPEGRLLYRAYKSHQKEGFIFNLNANDIVIPKHCPFLDVELSTNPKDYKESYYASIDRIDSSKGYVKGNIQIISMKANKMKTSATQEQLLQFAVNGLKLIEGIK